MQGTDQLIYDTARSDGMPEMLAVFIVAQARHETGNYTSRFFTQYKNAFGYSYVRGAKWQLPDPGPVADNGQGIATYSMVQNSVHELTDWIKRRQVAGVFPANLNAITSPEQYASLLKQASYFGAPLELYAAALRRHVEQLGEFVKDNGAAFAIAAAVVLLLMKYGKL